MEFLSGTRFIKSYCAGRKAFHLLLRVLKLGMITDCVIGDLG